MPVPLRRFFKNLFNFSDKFLSMCCIDKFGNQENNGNERDRTKMAKATKNPSKKFVTAHKKIRKSFGRLPEIAPMPSLIEVQKNSYDAFLQTGVKKSKRTDTGLQAAFKSMFPVQGFTGTCELHFESYELETPKYDVEECQQRDMTYGAPLRVHFRLVIFNIDEDTGSKSIREIKEQDVYMGDIPLMTQNGTFVVNGTERVIVSQMHRSPGVFFDHDAGKTHASGKYLFTSRIIPYRGSWLDFEFDPKDILNVRIDRRRKLPATTLLMALDNKETAEKRAKAIAEGTELPFEEQVGMSKEDILSFFYEFITYSKVAKGWKIPFNPETYKGTTPSEAIKDEKGTVIIEAQTKVTPRLLKKLAEEGVKNVLVQDTDLIGQFLSVALIDATTGEVLSSAGDEITEELLEIIATGGFKTISVLNINSKTGPWLRNTLALDKCENRNDALIDIQKVLRPGEPATPEAGAELFQDLFFSTDRYDLSAVGRVKMNARLNVSNDEVSDEVRILRNEDVLGIVKILLELKDGVGEVDDIDHLGNRRVRSVGELIENQYRVGLLRIERTIKERMGAADLETVVPQDLVNSRPASAAVREFFGSSQLSQFMDQTNPLSEITHKRRLSALGPGGLTRDRAGFEVRDVHPTHYGRICPIETPEGPNIGLINSLATYARINKYGFIESPYRRVENGVVSDEVIYMTAIEEGRYTVAQANTPITEGKFDEELISCRAGGDYILANSEEIQLMDVSPKQVVSVASSLIPFLENDDANRALMGANMQRQAVPLLQSDAPLVGTGMEAKVAADSGVSIVAKRSGVIDQVDATRIVVRVTGELKEDESGVDIYSLLKYQRSNQNSCINQRPLVKVGETIELGQILADGPSTEKGELALGRNVLVAFMPWNGYNFEDSILISERIVRDDVYTSIHIEEFEVQARDTKLGQEEITRDLPNVGEEALKNLDEAGIIYIGAEVNAGDILVGKVTPKGESPMTPEEKLLRAIFGEKASEVRDTSLRVPPGDRGTIVEVRVFNRRGVEKDARACAIEESEVKALMKDRDDEIKILERSFRNRLTDMIVGQEATSVPKGMKTGKITVADLEGLSTLNLKDIVVTIAKTNDQLEALKKQFDDSVKRVKARFEDKVEKVQAGDELLPGVMKMVEVFIAQKRKLQSGDKMAGRHGNKGVVSRIVPIQDLPYLEDGTAVDIVLNPLGVPSRMNVGQILETHLGWASAGLGRQVSEALETYRQSGDVKTVRTKLDDVYEDKDISGAIDKMSDEDVIELAHNVKKGVPMATPVFDGATEQDINNMLTKAGVCTSGQSRLIDGRTGEYFDRPVTVGYVYMLKLHHLVDDKIHARSIGPYSLVTQQPLGGKAQFGGQRFGEMEVWALEAYGAAYTLQEMLTVKSDDVSGRTKVYESIVRGDDTHETGVPESFNVLVKEMRSLGLNVEMKQDD